MEEKDRVLDELEARLAEREAELDAIRAEAERASDAARAEARAAFAALDAERAGLRARMAAARAARGPDWDRDGIDRSWSSFDAAVKSAHGRFRRGQ